jgi:hypothetical protein
MECNKGVREGMGRGIGHNIYVVMVGQRLLRLEVRNLHCLFLTALLSPCGADYVKGRAVPVTEKQSNVQDVELHPLTQNVPDIESMNRGRDDGKWIEKEQRGWCPMNEVELKKNRLSAWFNESGQKIVFQSKKIW